MFMAWSSAPFVQSWSTWWRASKTKLSRKSIPFKTDMKLCVWSNRHCNLLELAKGFEEAFDDEAR